LDTASESVPALPRHPRLDQILEQNWQAEMTGHCTYRALAERERDAGRKQSLEHMAAAEKEHAALWAARIRDIGPSQSTGANRPAMRIASKIESAAITWLCAAWRSMRAGISQNTAASSKN
jgi:Mn-containing catalase